MGSRYSNPIRGGFTDGGSSSWIEEMVGRASGIMPSQWADSHRPINREYAGETRLIVAVLEGGIKQYLGRPKQRDEAIAWFGTTEGPFSFDWCAEALGVYPAWFRHGLMRFLERCERGEVKWARQKTRGPWLREINQASTQPLIGRGKYRKARRR